MTLNQLESLTEDELAMCLYVVNVISPPDIPKVEFTARNLTWFRHDMLVQKLVDATPKVKEEAHDIYFSLLGKLGVKIEKTVCPTQNETTSSCGPSTNTGIGSQPT